jgi:hypothetical protein
MKLGGTGLSSTSNGGFFVHFGMVLAALAFASWWTTNTILDTARTRRVTEAVLENENLRHHVAGLIAPIAAQAVSPVSLATATGTRAGGANASSDALNQRVNAVLDRKDIRTNLEQFVVDAHDRLLGQGTGPAVLARPTVDAIVHAAIPTLPAAELAKIPPVRIDVPKAAPIAASRSALRNRMWLYTLGAIVLLAIALVTTRDRRATLKIIGAWLLGISAFHLIVLWVLPVLVLPNVTSNPWVGMVSGVARALGADLVAGLVVLTALGLGLLFIDRFVPATATAPDAAGQV